MNLPVTLPMRSVKSKKKSLKSKKKSLKSKKKSLKASNMTCQSLRTEPATPKCLRSWTRQGPSSYQKMQRLKPW